MPTNRKGLSIKTTQPFTDHTHTTMLRQKNYQRHYEALLISIKRLSGTNSVKEAVNEPGRKA